MWQIAMGVVSKTDENGNFILEACGQPNMKMARHFLEWPRPEKWGKHRKRHVPHNTGVLVIGGDATKAELISQRSFANKSVGLSSPRRFLSGIGWGPNFRTGASRQST
jgi:hypothetical protein